MAANSKRETRVYVLLFKAVTGQEKIFSTLKDNVCMKKLNQKLWTEPIKNI